MSLLAQNITKKGQINKLLKPQQELDLENNKKYAKDVICNSKIYIKERAGQLPELYYLIFWKIYLKLENTLEPTSIVMYFYKIISVFHKNYPEKSKIISSSIDYTPSIAKPSAKFIKILKQKQI